MVDPAGPLVEWENYARLKAIREQAYYTKPDGTIALISQDAEIARLKAEVQRLTRLKDAVFAWEASAEWCDFECHWTDYQSRGCNKLGADIWRAMLDLGAKFKGHKSWMQMQTDGNLEAYLKQDDAYRAAKEGKP